MILCFFTSSKNYFRILFLGAAVSFISACSSSMFRCSHFSEETKLYFVDSVSNKPLEHVIVVAYWQMYTGHSFPGDVLVLKEMVSDENGLAIIPSWGPLKTPKGSQLYRNSPTIVAYKRGYRYVVMSNRPLNHEGAPGDVTSQWDKKIVALDIFIGDDDALLRHLEAYADSIRYDRQGCFWEAVPRAFLHLHKMNSYFEAKQMENKLPGKQLVNQVGCENAIERFEE